MLKDPNFRGRAEQISILKDKVRDLNGRLLEKGSNFEPVQVPRNDRAKSGPIQTGLHKVELSKRKESEKLSLELKNLREHLKDAKIKNEGLTARTKILEKNYKDTKSKMLLLLNKGESDDKLIQALQTELRKTRSSSEQDTKMVQQQEMIDALEQRLQQVGSNQVGTASSGEHTEGNLLTLVKSLRSELEIIRKSKQEIEARYLEQEQQNRRNSTAVLIRGAYRRIRRAQIEAGQSFTKTTKDSTFDGTDRSFARRERSTQKYLGINSSNCPK